MAGVGTQKNAGRLLGVSERTVRTREKNKSALYWKWLVAEAALMMGVKKTEVYEMLNKES